MSHSVTMPASGPNELADLISLVCSISRALAEAGHHQAVEHLQVAMVMLDRHGRQ